MTGDDNPQAQQQGGAGWGFPGGGFGINIEDLIRSGAFGGFGHPGAGHGGQQQGGQRRRQQHFSFSFGGGDGMRFEF